MKNRIQKTLSLMLALVTVLVALPFAAVEATAETPSAKAKISNGYFYELHKDQNGQDEKTGETIYVTYAKITGTSENLSGNITIPSTLGGYPVREISGNAFSDRVNITSIVVPESVKYIEGGGWYDYSNEKSPRYGAFSCCTSLKSVTFLGNKTEIGHYAFFGCTALKNVELPKKIEYLNQNVFEGCSALESIYLPETLRGIGVFAFSNCSSLKSIVIPKSILTVSHGLFYKCTSLKSISLPEKIEEIGDSAFYGCSALKSIVIPKSTRFINAYAFYDCTSLSRISILSKNISYIGSYAFYNTVCYNNRSSWKNNVLYFGKYLIKAKKKISGNYTVKNGTSVIAEGAFEYCKLKSVSIPKSVTSIFGSTFANCTSLKEINLPNTLTDISFHAFSGCTSLENIVIPNSVTSIEDLAFENTALKTITLPKSVKKIGEKAIGYKNNKTVSGFVVKGYPGTVAEKYAKDNGFKFVSLDEHTHAFNKGVVTQKASFDSKGVKTFTCTECGATKTQAIAKLATAKLPKKNFAYTGKAIKPKVIIKDANGKQLQLGSDYTVKYKANKNIGKATVIVTFQGNYAGTKKITFNIVPAAPTVNVSAGKKTATLKFSGSSGADKYTIYYSTSKNSGYKKIAATAKNTYKVKNLTSGKAYFFKAVASKTVGKNTFNSSFSSPKKAVIK